MTEAQAIEAILQHWRVGWTAQQPLVLVSYDNEEPEAAEEFVRVAYRPSDRNNQAVGGGRLANVGNIAVQIFTRPLVGPGRGFELVDSVRVVLENATIASPLADDEPVCVYAVKVLDQSNNGGWQQITLGAEYRWDDIGKRSS